jgi:hypothetical protein
MITTSPHPLRRRVQRVRHDQEVLPAEIGEQQRDRIGDRVQRGRRLTRIGECHDLVVRAEPPAQVRGRRPAPADSRRNTGRT